MNNIESQRITLSLGLLAIFLTFIYSLDKILPKVGDKTSLFIQYIVSGYLWLICIFLVLFLLLKGIELRYRDKGKINYLDVHVPPKWGNYLFDDAISMAIYSPLGALTLIYFSYIPNFVTRIFLLSKFWKGFLSIGSYIIIFTIAYFILDYTCFKATGKQ